MLLERTLQLLYGHLQEYYSTLSFGLPLPLPPRIQLKEIIGGLARAGVSNRVIVVLENNAAGSADLVKLGRQALPPNFILLQLPRLELASSYPTIEPGGSEVLMDVNRMACPLEMYFGREALYGEDGRLLPILWTGYREDTAGYQGELQHQASVSMKCLERVKIALDSGKIEGDWSGMRQVFEAILQASIS
jgi:hypothetical protein